MLTESYIQIEQCGCGVGCKRMCNPGAAIHRVVLFGHGFGGHRDNRAAARFAKEFCYHYEDAAVITFDFPCHGSDKREILRLEDCLQYFAVMADYLQKTYPDALLDAYATSFGNGSAMRCSPCGLIAVTLEEALDLAEASAAVTHDHPEGILGAQATAAAIFLAKTGADKDTIRAYTEQHFYPLDFTLDEIRETYHFDVTCQGSAPQAIEAFLESESFEDAIRGVISIGGDSDTHGAITGSIAWSYYRYPDRADGTCEKILTDYRIAEMLPEGFPTVISAFEEICGERFASYQQTGHCSSIRLS